MKKAKKWLILLALAVILAGVYLYPAPMGTFDKLYANVEPHAAASLQAFRKAHSLQTLEVGGQNWEYLSLMPDSRPAETILFLHGMTGAYDIWWPQIEALQHNYHIIAVTYPPANSLEEMEQAVMAILDAEGVDRFNVVGTSLGGYFAQFLVARHPDRIQRAVFSNTFPPNDIIAENNKTIGAALPYLPEWLVMNVLSSSMRERIYPASGYSELVLAFGLEQTHGRMVKAQVVGRFHCVVDPFVPPVPLIPVLIIESDNDPLVEPALRAQLKETYPAAAVYTFSDAGHFPYLNRPDEYTAALREFFNTALP